MQHVESIWLDCDGDVLLIKARQVGGACHEGYRSCFFRRVGALTEHLELARLRAAIFDGRETRLSDEATMRIARETSEVTPQSI